jgi:hypothetical protein
MLELCILARLATDFDPVELGHHPIENRPTVLRVVCNSNREVASSSAIRIFIGMLLLTRLG